MSDLTIEQQLAAANARIARMAEENERLTALLPPLPAPGQVWRPGSKCLSNVYAHADGLAEQGEPVGVMRSAQLAAHVVQAVNAWNWDGEITEGRKVLDLPMDGDYPTIRDYLTALLARLWSELGSFSGKYGLGDSDWYWTLYAALVHAGMVNGSLDEDGNLRSCDEAEAHRLIHAAIAELGVAR